MLYPFMVFIVDNISLFYRVRDKPLFGQVYLFFNFLWVWQRLLKWIAKKLSLKWQCHWRFVVPLRLSGHLTLDPHLGTWTWTWTWTKRNPRNGRGMGGAWAGHGRGVGGTSIQFTTTQFNPIKVG